LCQETGGVVEVPRLCVFFKRILYSENRLWAFLVHLENVSECRLKPVNLTSSMADIRYILIEIVLNFVSKFSSELRE
jgi:hypothetical protein